MNPDDEISERRLSVASIEHMRLLKLANSVSLAMQMGIREIFISFTTRIQNRLKKFQMKTTRKQFRFKLYFIFRSFIKLIYIIIASYCLKLNYIHT